MAWCSVLESVSGTGILAMHRSLLDGLGDGDTCIPLAMLCGLESLKEVPCDATEHPRVSTPPHTRISPLNTPEGEPLF